MRLIPGQLSPIHQSTDELPLGLSPRVNAFADGGIITIGATEEAGDRESRGSNPTTIY